MQTRKFPRTMYEAFGPYTSHDLLPMRQPRQRGDVLASVILAVILGIAGAALLFVKL